MPLHDGLSVIGVRRSFGSVTALAGFDLRVEPGEIVGLIGPNGAGKSTVDRVVAGVLRPDAGEVTVGGVDRRHDPRRARGRCGLAAQDVALYPTATVRENLVLFGRVAGLHGGTLRRGVERVCSDLLLDAVLGRRVATLSGGQQRRVHAAVAMLPAPPVLLLDEPTVGADPASRQALLAAVRRRADEGCAVVYTTHYLPEIPALGATLAVAVRGRVVARGPVAELLASAPAADLDGLFAHWAGEPPPEATAPGVPAPRPRQVPRAG